jgi:three-Cys-motif partner protein
VPEDPVVFEEKKVPTRLKHWLLDRLLGAWGGIIINSNFGYKPINLCFIDTCCGSGLYKSADIQGDADEQHYEEGSALIGPLALAKLRDFAKGEHKTAKTRAVLINSNRRELQTAKRVIDEAPLYKDVPLVKAVDEIDYQKQTLEEAKGHVLTKMKNYFSFVFMDPYGPKPAPFSVASEIVSRPHTDTLINLPFYSFQKWTGLLGKADANAVAKLKAADRFMGGPEWRGLAAEAKAQGKAFEHILAEHYRSRLEQLGVRALVLPLRGERSSNVMYHLVFTSRNVAGLSSAKKEFHSARGKEFELVQAAVTRKSGQTFIDYGMPGGPGPTVVVGDLADALFERFQGQRVSVEHVISHGLNLDRVLEGDVKKALTRLRNDNRAAVSSEKHYDDPVTFVQAAGKKTH